MWCATNDVFRWLDGCFCAILYSNTTSVLVFQSYEEATTAVSEADRKYVTDKCLAALYIPLLLNHGLGFSNNSNMIHVLAHIAGQKPGKHCDSYEYLLRGSRLIANMMSRVIC